MYNVIYIAIVTAVGLAVRYFYSVNIADNVSLGIGVILCICGLVVLFIESRDTESSYFYSYAKNWNGWGLINSGLILGISVFFMGITLKIGILYAVAVCAVNLIIRVLVGQSAGNKRKEALGK